MGQIKKKSFRHPRSYYWRFVYYCLIIIGAGALFVNFLFFETEESLYNQITNRKLIGNAGQRSAILLEQFLVRTFGRNELLAVLVFVATISIYELYKEIATYRRYKRKCRLYETGGIKHVYDIYDDYVPMPLWRRCVNLFVKREKRYKHPTKREMRKKLRQYYKNNLEKQD